MLCFVVSEYMEFMGRKPSRNTNNLLVSFYGKWRHRHRGIHSLLVWRRAMNVSWQTSALKLTYGNAEFQKKVPGYYPGTPLEKVGDSLETRSVKWTLTLQLLNRGCALHTSKYIIGCHRQCWTVKLERDSKSCKNRFDDNNSRSLWWAYLCDGLAMAKRSVVWCSRFLVQRSTRHSLLWSQFMAQLTRKAYQVTITLV